MSNKKILDRLLLTLLAAVLTTSCTSQKLVSGQKEMGASFQSGNYQRAATIADSLKKNNIYKAKDRVLYSLEMGTINFFQADYSESISSFSNAEEYMDQFFTKSATTGVKAFITNDNQLNYNGEVYEDVYLNGFKSLAYLQEHKYEDALVEARRISQKMARAESKYKGLASSLQDADTTDAEIEWNAGTSSIHDSPLSRYLATVLYAKYGTKDDARIEYEKMKQAILNHKALPNSQLEFVQEFTKITNPEKYNVLLTAFCGSAPIKRPNNIRIRDLPDVAGLKIAIPELVMRPTTVNEIKVVVDGRRTFTIPILEEMDKVARETFKIKKPIIVARATVRGILKSAGQQALANEAEDEMGENTGRIVNLLAGQVREASEKADLRGWQTMPGKVHANVIKLSAGKHNVRFEYYSDQGRLLHSEELPINIKTKGQINSISSIYSN